MARFVALFFREAFADTVVHHKQDLRLQPVVIGVHQYGALLELAAVGRKDQISSGVHQRMAGMNQVGHGFAMHPDQLLFKADTFVLLQHRGARLANDPVSLANGGRHVAHLVATGFTGAHFTVEVLKGLGEEGADEVGLQFARLGLFHLLLDRVEVLQAHVLLDQGIAAQDLPQVLGVQRTLDDLVKFVFDF